MRPLSLVLFRKYHVQLAREAWGKDTSMVTPPTQKDHIVEQVILKQDTNDETQLRAVQQNTWQNKWLSACDTNNRFRDL